MSTGPSAAPRQSVRARTGALFRLAGALAPRRVPGSALAVATVAVAVAFVIATATRPAYDPYGWLVWGHQAWGLSLNTDAAPSWKPLTYLFTAAFAPLGRGAVGLWMVTAATGAFAAPVLAARVAHRLGGRGAAAAAAGVLAGVGVLDLGGFWHEVLTATADPAIVALCLGAIDRHLAGRRTMAFGLLLLAALGRPESALFALLYAVWLGRAATPRVRAWLAGGLALVVALWIGVPALTSHTPFSAGTTALTAAAPVHGNRLLVTLRHFATINALAVHLAAAAVLVFALRRRRAGAAVSPGAAVARTILVLAAAASLWVLAWCGLALGGWEPDPRYMFEPAAVEVVIAAVGVGLALSARPPRRRDRLVLVGASALLVLALVPVTRIELRRAHDGVLLGRNWADQLGRLQAAVGRDGGPRRILACGAPVTVLTYQSVLAYDLAENVSAVSWQPGAAIAQGRPIVLFLPYVAGWHIRPIHTAAAEVARCRGLRMTTPYAYSASFRDFLRREGLLGPNGLACGLPGTPSCRRRV